MPELGRSLGEGKGYPLQYSGLENSMDYAVHRVAKSWRRLRDFHFNFLHIEEVFSGFYKGKQQSQSYLWLWLIWRITLLGPSFEAGRTDRTIVEICCIKSTWMVRWGSRVESEWFLEKNLVITLVNKLERKERKGSRDGSLVSNLRVEWVIGGATNWERSAGRAALREGATMPDWVSLGHLCDVQAETHTWTLGSTTEARGQAWSTHLEVNSIQVVDESCWRRKS